MSLWEQPATNVCRLLCHCSLVMLTWKAGTMLTLPWTHRRESFPLPHEIMSADKKSQQQHLCGSEKQVISSRLCCSFQFLLCSCSCQNTASLVRYPEFFFFWNNNIIQNPIEESYWFQWTMTQAPKLFTSFYNLALSAETRDTLSSVSASQ